MTDWGFTLLKFDFVLFVMLRSKLYCCLLEEVDGKSRNSPFMTYRSFGFESKSKKEVEKYWLNFHLLLLI